MFYLVLSLLKVQKIIQPEIRKWALYVIIFCALPFFVTLAMLLSSSVETDWQISLFALFLQIGFLSFFTMKLPLMTSTGPRTALKYQHSNLSVSETKLHRQRLEELMETEKLYTHKNLSLPMFGK